MYRYLDLVSSLSTVLGWRKDYNPNGIAVANSLQATESGAYYQDIHPLLTLENIKSIAPRLEEVAYTAWNGQIVYLKGALVTEAGITYEALQESLGLSPTASGAELYWEPTTQFSIWLRQKSQASIGKLVQRLWSTKIAEQTAKNVLEHKYLFNNTGRINDTIPNQARLVGFEITPIRANGVTTRIDKVGFQSTGQGTVDFYLMHSSSKYPVKAFTLSSLKMGGMEWFDLGAYLPYAGVDTDAGGSWYLVYRQSTLPEGMQAINKERDWSKKPCSSCSTYDLQAYNLWSRFIEIHPFYVDESLIEAPGDFNNDVNNDFNGPALKIWDITDNVYTYDKNYGLNLQLTVECDPTDILVSHKLALQNLIGLQVASDMLREMAYNSSARVNKNQQNASAMQILYELDGDSTSPKKSGLEYQLQKSIDALSIDLTSMSRVCFTCKKKGVKFRTV